MVESWIEEEKTAMTSDVFEQTSKLLSSLYETRKVAVLCSIVTTEWKSHYFQILQSFYFARLAIHCPMAMIIRRYTFRDQLTRSPPKECSSMREKIFKYAN